jgi:hypothetical protein
MAIDQSAISLNAANAQTRQAAYVQTYCSTQGPCPEGWQDKLAKNYPLARLAAPTSPEAKVADTRMEAAIPEAELKHSSQCAEVHGTAAVAAACDVAVEALSKQMKEAQNRLAPEVKVAQAATVKEKRHAALRKKHGHHYQHNAHLADGTRADGHHKRDAKAASHAKAAMASAVKNPLPTHPEDDSLMARIRKNQNLLVARWDNDHSTYA